MYAPTCMFTRTVRRSRCCPRRLATYPLGVSNASPAEYALHDFPVQIPSAAHISAGSGVLISSGYAAFRAGKSNADLLLQATLHLRSSYSLGDRTEATGALRRAKAHPG